MSTRFLLTLLCLPTVLSALTLPLTASAASVRSDKHVTRSSLAPASCSISDDKAAVDGIAGKSNGDVMSLDFSAAASDAAVLLFGCDCPSCINALEQLRRPSLMAAAQGHCLGSTEEQDMNQVDAVLEAVDAAEAISPDVGLPRGKF